MLVLSREVNQRIFINHDITIQVISIKGKKVRLGISAPDDAIIDREEVFHVKARTQRHDSERISPAV